MKSQKLFHNKNDNTNVSSNEQPAVIREKTTSVSEKKKDNSLKCASVTPRNKGEGTCEVDIVSERTVERQKGRLIPDAIDTQNKYEVLERLKIYHKLQWF